MGCPVDEPASATGQTHTLVIKPIYDLIRRSLGEWQRAILVGFEVWRQVLSAGGGKILVDQDAKSLTFLGPPKSARRKPAHKP
ncbi:hypothetical protein AB4142_06870 [Variovorax sp. 2RAF20]